MFLCDVFAVLPPVLGCRCTRRVSQGTQNYPIVATADGRLDIDGIGTEMWGIAMGTLLMESMVLGLSESV